MDKERLDDEFKEYSSDELQYIHDTQQDLYSEDELLYMQQAIEEKRAVEQAAIAEYLPDKIDCEKCGGPNPFDNEVCQYCGWKMDKSAYRDMAEASYRGEISSEDGGDDAQDNPYPFHYIISILIPLVGFIMGGIYLTKSDEDERSVGKTCIVLGIASGAVCSLIALFIM